MYQKNLFISLLLAFLAFFIPITAFAINGSGLMQNIPPNPHENAGAATSPTIYTEIHYVNLSSCGNTVENYCSPGGTYASGTLQSINGNCAYTYNCYVPFTRAQLSNLDNSRTQGELNGFYTIPNTVDGQNKPVTDIATLRFQNGFPATTFVMNAEFDWGAGKGVLCSAQVNFQFGGQTASGGNPANPDDCNNSASIQQTVAPFQSVYIKKNVNHNGGWNDSCDGYYTVKPSDIGKTITLDCCLSPNGATCQKWCQGNQNWGSGGLPSYIFGGGWCPQ